MEGITELIDFDDISSITFDDIIGCEAAVKMAKELSRFNVNILLLGETGVGKELFANAIHNNSESGSRFVSLNCSTIPSTLLDTELFGCIKEAYTDAGNDRIGKLEYAHNGTLFFDEIGNLSLEAQVKLLSVIEYRQFYRIGDNQVRKINVRFIFATNVNLIDAVSKGHFRKDLYYRICAHPIHIPPLRDRKEEIIHLIMFYWNTWNSKTNCDIELLHENEYSLFLKYGFPGNVRELKGLLESIYIYSRTNGVNKRYRYIKEEINNRYRHRQYQPLNIIIKNYIQEVVQNSKNINVAAKILNIDRKTVIKYL